MFKPILKTMRPKQWTKNLFIFAPLVFDEKLFQMNYLLKTVSGFILMCLLSSTVYIINDLVDIEKDRQHPAKRHRPLPSGQLSPKVAAGFAILLPLACLPLSFLLDRLFGLTALTYLTVMVAYSFFLKNVLIIDVLTIAAGFVLRVAGGVVLVDVVRFSPWLYLCTTLLALFLGLSKRRHELMLLQQNAGEHRSILNEYSPYLLDEMIAVVTSTTVIAYSLYTFTAPNMPKNHVMMLTIPFVLYGIFRYLYIIHQKNEGGSPEEILIKDIPLIADIGLWGLMVVLFLYLF